jgi:hypothetical protein
MRKESNFSSNRSDSNLKQEPLATVFSQVNEFAISSCEVLVVLYIILYVTMVLKISHQDDTDRYLILYREDESP